MQQAQERRIPSDFDQRMQLVATIARQQADDRNKSAKSMSEEQTRVPESPEKSVPQRPHHLQDMSHYQVLQWKQERLQHNAQAYAEQVMGKQLY